MPFFAVRIVGAPGGVSDHVGLVRKHVARNIQHQAVARELAGGLEQPGIALGVIAAFQIDHEFSAITGLERAVDHALDVVKIKSGQARHEIDGKVGMTEQRVGFSEKRIRDAGGHRVGAAVQIEVEQRQFGIHRSGFGGNAQIAADLQRDSVRCDDVENFLGELVAAQVVLDGASDLIVEFGARDLFVGGGVDPANVGSGNVAASA